MSNQILAAHGLFSRVSYPPTIRSCVFSHLVLHLFYFVKVFDNVDDNYNNDDDNDNNDDDNDNYDDKDNGDGTSPTVWCRQA